MAMTNILETYHTGWYLKLKGEEVIYKSIFDK